MTKIFVGVIGAVAWFGFAGPACVSSQSSLLAFGWPIAALGGALWLINRATKNKGEKK